MVLFRRPPCCEEQCHLVSCCRGWRWGGQSALSVARSPGCPGVRDRAPGALLTPLLCPQSRLSSLRQALALCHGQVRAGVEAQRSPSPRCPRARVAAVAAGPAGCPCVCEPLPRTGLLEGINDDEIGAETIPFSPQHPPQRGSRLLCGFEVPKPTAILEGYQYSPPAFYQIK